VTLLRDLVLVFAVAVPVVGVLRWAGIPTIAGFLVAGAVIGPNMIGLVPHVEQVEALSEVGVVLLLFGIGIELSPGRLRRLWRPVILGGSLQVGITMVLTTGVALAFGLAANAAIFLGFLMAVSSTAIVLRGMEMRGELQAPHGRLTLGILVFQDLCVVPMMLALPLLEEPGVFGKGPLLSLARTVGLVAALVAGGRYLFPHLLHLVAKTRQRDLFIMAVVVLCLGTAWVMSRVGISLALGAFLAGLVVSESEYRHQALADLIPLREVLAGLFFVSVGMLLDPKALVENWWPVLGLFLAILLGKGLVLLLVGTVLRLPLRVSILAGGALAQVGEFSFVLTRAARPDLLPVAVSEPFLIATILSMVVTPLALAMGPHLAAGAVRLRPLTRPLQVRIPEDDPELENVLRDHVIIAGYGLSGSQLARSLMDCGVPYVVLDLNPANVRRAMGNLDPAFFGDVTSPDVLRGLALPMARELVVSVNNADAAVRAVRAAREVAPGVHILVRAPYEADLSRMLDAGASEVVVAERESAAAVTASVLKRCRASAEVIAAEADRVREGE